MLEENRQTSLEALNEIRSIMERSARFLSLSGWSGIWAGTVALVGSFVAGGWIAELGRYPELHPAAVRFSDGPGSRFLVLALAVFVAALGGSFFFTWAKVRRQGGRLWGQASRRLMIAVAVPLLAGGLFAMSLLYQGLFLFAAPCCLVFYGMALLNGSKYTLSEIRYLGYALLALGCINLFFTKYGLYFWAAGFGGLHIVYGAIMWFRYDRHDVSQR